MGLDQNFFSLSQQQLENLNAYIAEQMEKAIAAGEDQPQSVRTQFSWTVFGRYIDVFVDGDINGHTIESPWESLGGADHLEDSEVQERKKR